MDGVRKIHFVFGAGIKIDFAVEQSEVGHVPPHIERLVAGRSRLNSGDLRSGRIARPAVEHPPFSHDADFRRQRRATLGRVGGGCEARDLGFFIADNAVVRDGVHNRRPLGVECLVARGVRRDFRHGIAVELVIHEPAGERVAFARIGRGESLRRAVRVVVGFEPVLGHACAHVGDVVRDRRRALALDLEVGRTIQLDHVVRVRRPLRRRACVVTGIDDRILAADLQRALAFGTVSATDTRRCCAFIGAANGSHIAAVDLDRAAATTLSGTTTATDACASSNSRTGVGERTAGRRHSSTVDLHRAAIRSHSAT